MNNEKIDLIRTFLENHNCSEINIYPETKYKFNNDKNYLNLYKIDFINLRNQNISLYIKVNDADFIYRASNNINNSWWRSVINFTQDQINNLITEYRNTNNNRLMHQTKFPKQYYPNMFLNSLNDNRLNYYVEIFKYHNIVWQDNRPNNYIFMDCLENFIDKYLPELI